MGICSVYFIQTAKLRAPTLPVHAHSTQSSLSRRHLIKREFRYAFGRIVEENHIVLSASGRVAAPFCAWELLFDAKRNCEYIHQYSSSLHIPVLRLNLMWTKSGGVIRRPSRVPITFRGSTFPDHPPENPLLAHLALTQLDGTRGLALSD